MRKVILFCAAAILAGKAVAATVGDDEQIINQYQEEDIIPVTTTYLDGVYSGNGWDANWFATLQGGMSAFIGKPVGHGDFFDRTKPMLNIAVGKWVSPTVGLRLSMQGFRFVDGAMQSRSFQNIHADLMYNVTNAFREDHEALAKWDMIPFVGLGLVHNKFAGAHPLGMTVGIAGRYRLNERLHITGEMANTFTAQHFDAIGENKVIGDNILQANIGLSVTIGKVGWKRVVDPKPYIFQNDQLMSRLERANDKIHKLNVQRLKDEASLREMHKILEIEGLLEKYELGAYETTDEVKKYPKNNYSGLNSLRARLRNRNLSDDGQPRLRETGAYASKEWEPMAWNPSDSTTVRPEEYFKLMKDGKIFVGTPVFFFFKIGTTQLGEKAQIINIREIASVIKRFGLTARVVGAADSQTGSAYTNEQLSQKRAEYIAKELKRQGVDDEHIETQYRGGINSYVPLQGNRNTCVMFYFK